MSNETVSEYQGKMKVPRKIATTCQNMGIRYGDGEPI